MRKLPITLMAATFVLGMSVLTASAQTQQLGASSLTQLRNVTPIVTPAACRGLGPYCGPGWVRRCWRGPHGYLHCRCVPCY